VPDERPLHNPPLFAETTGTPETTSGVPGAPTSSSSGAAGPDGTPGTPAQKSGVPPVTDENINDIQAFLDDGTPEHAEHRKNSRELNFSTARIRQRSSADTIPPPSNGVPGVLVVPETSIELIARLDLERNDADRMAGRGY